MTLKEKEEEKRRMIAAQKLYHEELNEKKKAVHDSHIRKAGHVAHILQVQKGVQITDKINQREQIQDERQQRANQERVWKQREDAIKKVKAAEKAANA